MAALGPAIRSSRRRRNSLRDDHDDELIWQTSQEKADAVSHLFRRRPHNLIEKIEKLGFTYRSKAARMKIGKLCFICAG
jgi:hypothetical protein